MKAKDYAEQLNNGVISVAKVCVEIHTEGQLLAKKRGITNGLNPGFVAAHAEQVQKFRAIIRQATTVNIQMRDLQIMYRIRSPQTCRRLEERKVFVS